MLISSSRLKAYNACRRLHYYKYTLGYRPLLDREAAEFGTIMHKGLEAWWRAHQDGRPSQALDDALAAILKACTDAGVDEATSIKAQLLMAGYDARWSADMADLQVMVVEGKFEAALPTPVGAKNRRMLIAGRLDVLVRRRSTGEVWVVEHKTTSADLTPGSTYWQRLRMDTQVSVYFEGATILACAPPTGCIYDVISKPEIRQLKATPMEARKYTKEKRDKAGNITEPSRLYSNQREFDETIEEFKERLLTSIVAAPDAYFQRQEVVRTEAELEESRRDTYDTALMIRETENAERAPRNPDACFLYGRVCDFYEICCQVASLDDTSRFKRLTNVHPELEDDSASR